MKALLKKFYNRLANEKSTKEMGIEITPENPALMKYLGSPDSTTERGKFSPRSADTQQLQGTRARTATLDIPYSADKIVSSNEEIFDPNPGLLRKKSELDKQIKDASRPSAINTGVVERLKGAAPNGMYSLRESPQHEEEYKEKEEKRNGEGSPSQFIERQGSRRSPLRKTTTLHLGMDTLPNSTAPLENKECNTWGKE